MIDEKRGLGRPRKVVETTTTTKEIDPEEKEAAAVSDVGPEYEEQDELRQFLSQFSPEGQVTAWRVRITGEKDYCGLIGAQEASLDWLQKTYGGGRYTILYYDRQRRIQGSRRFNIAEPKFAPIQAVPTAAPAAAPAAGLDPMIQLQIETMREESRTNRELMLKMVEKLGDGNHGDRNEGGLTTLVEALAGLKNLTKPSDGEITGMISMLEKGISLGSSGAVPAKSEGIAGIVREWAPVIGEALRRAMAGRGADLPQSVSTGNPGGAVETVTALEQCNSLGQQQQADRNNLLSGLVWLKKRCLAGMHVDSALDLLMYSIDDPDWQFLFEFILMPYEEWGKVDADLLKPQYRPWFESLLGGLKMQVQARMADATGQEEREVIDATADLSASGPDGNGSDFAGDGQPGSRGGNVRADAKSRS